MKPGYTKKIDIKVVRTVHEIALWHGSTAGQIIKYLENVPREAKLTDIDEEEQTTILEFTEEQEEQPNDN